VNCHFPLLASLIEIYLVHSVDFMVGRVDLDVVICVLPLYDLVMTF
jgi:hypothetical protein